MHVQAHCKPILLEEFALESTLWVQKYFKTSEKIRMVAMETLASQRAGGLGLHALRALMTVNVVCASRVGESHGVCEYVRLLACKASLACKWACMYMCLCVCMHACMYVCMHVCLYACMYACMYVFVYVCMCACVYVCMCVCVHVCMCVCVYVSMSTYLCMYASIVTSS